jgi:organic hydroperoxide reductase OsmC/OhrA
MDCCTWPEHFATETVWDHGLVATGCASGDRTLDVGPDGTWMPEQLLLLAAEGAYMTTLLEMAERRGIRVLGYVSTAELVARGVDLPPSIALFPCIVVASEEDAEALRTLAHQVVWESQVAQLLGERLHVVPDVRAAAAAVPE